MSSICRQNVCNVNKRKNMDNKSVHISNINVVQLLYK